ncbi:MAG: sodium:solute symporter [Bacteroidales bacterium]|jgi:Na+/proline symporter|nr:sodium:solute symporter [Bacteroidales bacterium]
MQIIIFTCFVIYTIVIFLVTWLTTRKANNESFYIGNRQSPWFVVAYGMIGASLSGVTFMSVPGWVDTRAFSYMLTVFGYFLGYLVISFLLMPAYYKLKLTSIYQYLELRFGFWTHKTGSFFFLLSRTLGASLRIFLVILVLHEFVFSYWGFRFELTVVMFLFLILAYTLKGGVKTIIWTDTLQTTFMLASLIISVILICKAMDMSFGEMFTTIKNSRYSQVIFTDNTSRLCWWKQILGGMFITISMTGLDQEMMQKNLSCKNIKSAQKNMFSFSIIIIFVNFLFLFLGAALYLYAAANNIDVKGDELFASIAINHLGVGAGVIFIIGLISALYPSADGALTSLTTSFSVDFLNLEKRTDFTEKKKTHIRYVVHSGFALLFIAIIIFYEQHRSANLIDILFRIASITYGPLLGLFVFGLIMKRKIQDKLAPIVCVLSPVICFILSQNSLKWFNYSFDFELLLLNGLLTFVGLLFISKKNNSVSLHV